MRRAAKRDNNEAQIVRDLRYCGYLVKHQTDFDLLVSARGQVWMMDVKAENGVPTESQLKMIQDGWPLHFVVTSEQALEIVRPK